MGLNVSTTKILPAARLAARAPPMAELSDRLIGGNTCATGWRRLP
jgi:hypothetical protein